MVLIAVLLFAARAAAGARDWPGNKPLKFEAIALAGGLADILSRRLSPRVSASIGGTPAPIIARPDAAIAGALALPEVREPFAKQGIETFYMNAQQLGVFLQSEAAHFSSLLKHSRVVKPPQRQATHYGF